MIIFIFIICIHFFWKFQIFFNCYFLHCNCLRSLKFSQPLSRNNFSVFWMVEDRSDAFQCVRFGIIMVFCFVSEITPSSHRRTVCLVENRKINRVVMSCVNFNSFAPSKKSRVSAHIITIIIIYLLYLRRPSIIITE